MAEEVTVSEHQRDSAALSRAQDPQGLLSQESIGNGGDPVSAFWAPGRTPLSAFGLEKNQAMK